jgi:hypothetical protein
MLDGDVMGFFFLSVLIILILLYGFVLVSAFAVSMSILYIIKEFQFNVLLQNQVCQA